MYYTLIVLVIFYTFLYIYNEGKLSPDSSTMDGT
jgi:hypothetical protein